MDLTPAPFFDDVDGGPAGGTAYWVTTSDKMQIRVGLWPLAGARGTVLLFPGRTEYIEKYGETAKQLAERGYATLAIDWRGQGLADRMLDDRRIGHVIRFADYQKDVAAMLRAARALDLPRPFHLLAHSMGGAIGLRAVMEGLGVQSCAFTGPMWGIYLSPVMRPVGWAVAFAAPALGFGTRLSPNTSLDGYVLSNEFEGNTLTHDPAMYQMMRDQLNAHPDLGLGGPSLVWLREALTESRALAARPSPDIPCITFLGAEETIIDCDAVRDRMQAWPRGDLDEVQGARHEVLMELPEMRTRVFDRLATLFATGDVGKNG